MIGVVYTVNIDILGRIDHTDEIQSRSHYIQQCRRDAFAYSSKVLHNKSFHTHTTHYYLAGRFFRVVLECSLGND